MESIKPLQEAGIMRAWKNLLAGVLALMLIAGPVLAYDQEQSRRDPDSAEMFVDAVVGRPFGLIAIVLGTAAFVVSLPFTIPSHSTDEAAKTLVRVPVAHTFKRPLGRFISCQEQPDFCK
jgi:hypothetical protein